MRAAVPDEDRRLRPGRAKIVRRVEERHRLPGRPDEGGELRRDPRRPDARRDNYDIRGMGPPIGDDAPKVGVDGVDAGARVQDGARMRQPGGKAVKDRTQVRLGTKLTVRAAAQTS